MSSQRSFHCRRMVLQAKNDDEISRLPQRIRVATILYDFIMPRFQMFYFIKTSHLLHEYFRELLYSYSYTTSSREYFSATLLHLEKYSSTFGWPIERLWWIPAMRTNKRCRITCPMQERTYCLNMQLIGDMMMVISPLI